MTHIINPLLVINYITQLRDTQKSDNERNSIDFGPIYSLIYTLYGVFDRSIDSFFTNNRHSNHDSVKNLLIRRKKFAKSVENYYKIMVNNSKIYLRSN